MSLETKTYLEYEVDKRKTLVQSALIGAFLGFGTKMIFNQENAFGGVLMPALITGNNRQKDAKSYAKNIIAYNLGFFVGYAAYNALELLINR